MWKGVGLLLTLLVVVEVAAAFDGRRTTSLPRPHLPSRDAREAYFAANGSPLPSSAGCTTLWFTQTLDHFSASPGTYRQRYFVCLDAEADKPSASVDIGAAAPQNRPVFFYCGNEANVELYVNATGLMWENAKEFNAVLVFAEHRYFGESVPFKAPLSNKQMSWLSADQAMADFAVLISWLREYKYTGPYVGFGGSYGGMLATWMAVKYPAALDGVIAGSAPVVSFLDLSPSYDTGAYAKGVTFDATEAGGASANCRENIQRSWPSLFDLGKSAEGRETLNKVFKLCPTAKLNSSNDIFTLAFWLQSSFDYMAMGSYPFPSSYILNGKGELPAYPVRVGCSGALSREPSKLSTTERLAGLRDAAAVFYNYTGAATGACFDTAGSANKETQEDATRWDYLFCGGILQPASRSGPPADMFWDQPFSLEETQNGCKQRWGNETIPLPDWPRASWGGWRALERSSVPIVFSNGELDPWKNGGVTSNLSKAVTAIVIADVGHHVDLMFSNPRDTDAIRNARAYEVGKIREWISKRNGDRAAVQ